MKNIIVFVLLFGLGCAYVPQQATIAPEIEIIKSSIGAGTHVYLQVVDERDDTVIGHRGSAYGKAAEITTTQDIRTIFIEEISKGLKANQFTIIEDRDSASVFLRIDIRLLEYSTSTGFWTGGVHTKAALKGTAKRGDIIYEKMYRSENEDRVMVVPDAKTNESYINAVVEDILLELFSDNDLLIFMTEKSRGV